MSSETWGKAPPGTATVRPSSARATRASRAGSASFPASRANGQGGAQVQQQVDGHLPVDPGQQSTDGIDGGSVPLPRQCGRGHRPHSRSGGRSPPRPSAVPRAARARSPGAASRSVRCTPPGSRRAPVSARPRRTGRRSSPDGAGARLSRGAVPFASGPSPVPPEPLLGRVGGSKGARPPPVCPGGDAREPSGHAAGHGQNGNVERFGHRGFPSALPAAFPSRQGPCPRTRTTPTEGVRPTSRPGTAATGKRSDFPTFRDPGIRPRCTGRGAQHPRVAFVVGHSCFRAVLASPGYAPRRHWGKRRRRPRPSGRRPERRTCR